MSWKMLMGLGVPVVAAAYQIGPSNVSLLFPAFLR